MRNGRMRILEKLASGTLAPSKSAAENEIENGFYHF